MQMHQTRLKAEDFMAASKKKTSTSSNHSSSNRSSKKKGTAHQPVKYSNESSFNTVEMIGWGMICLGVVALIVLLPLSSPNNAFRLVLGGLAGCLSFVLPLVLIWIGLLTAFSGKRQMDTARIAMIAGCILLGFSMIHIFSANTILSHLRLKSGWLNFISQSYIDRLGTGAIGALLAYPAYVMGCGQWGGFVILLFVLMGMVFILQNISLRKFGERAQKYISDSYSDMRQNYTARSAERAVLRAEQAENRRAAAQERREQQARRRTEQQNWDASWDDVTYNAPMSSSSSSSRAERPVYTASSARSGSGFEMPDYLKNGAGRKKPVFGEAQPATAEEEAMYAEDAPFDAEYPSEELPAEYEYAQDTDAQEDAPVYDGFCEDQADDEPSEASEETYPAESSEEYFTDDPFADESSSDEEYDEEPLDIPYAPESVDSQTDEEYEEDADDANGLVFPSFEGFDSPVERERRRPVLGAPSSSASRPASETPASSAPKPVIRPVSELTAPAVKKAPAVQETVEYNYPTVDLLALPSHRREADREVRDKEKAQKLEATLHNFGINAKLTGIAHGPAVTRFELSPAPGVKVSRITALVDDIALSLAAESVRIEAPIPGKAAVGVEIPNEVVETVPLREVLESGDARKHPSRLAIALGKDNSGRHIVGDIAKMPHVLIAGATGSGKSVCINCIICSILYRAAPDEVRLIMIDPKMVELSIYNDIPHLLVPVVTDPKKASGALQWAVSEMSARYEKFKVRGVRDIKGYNSSCSPDEKPLPQIVIIIDELADLMMVCPGEVEDSICRLAQLARAAGIHLVIATQRPSVNVITGVIKANIPARIAFTVASSVDSRTILDVGGAEKLLGRGDMLFAPNGNNKMQRVQGAWVSDDEVHAIVDYIKERHDAEYSEDILEHMNRTDDSAEPEAEEPASEGDPLLQQAVEIAVESGQASISMLQRRLRIGYARAGRLIDEMASRGIVSQSEGAKPRNVLISREQYNLMFHISSPTE